MGADTCRCGHSRDVHEHYRDGSDCSVCGRALCPTYRNPPTQLAQAAARRINRVLALLRRRT